MTRLAIQSGLVRGASLREKYETARGYGFDGMELQGFPMIEDGHLGSFNIESALPWDVVDLRVLREAPLEAIARHWPEAPALLERAGVAPWGPVNEFYDIRRAGDLLGWRPRWGFNEYLAALRDGREEL